MRLWVIVALVVFSAGVASADSLHELADQPGKAAEIAKALAAGADPEAKNDKGWTPLGIAAAAGHLDLVEALVAGGAEVDGRGYAGRTPLTSIAANHLWNEEEGRPERLMKVARFLVGKGAAIEAFDHRGWSALILAAANGHTELVRLLVEQGATVDLPMTDGYNALHHSAARGKTETVAFLLESGADPNAVTKDGRTPLALAQRYGHTDTAEVILSRGGM